MNGAFDTLQSTYRKETSVIKKSIEDLFKNRDPRSLYEPCAYAFEGDGKYLRSFLVLLSAKAAGGNFSDTYNAAIAAELVHNFTLIHDDIMDRSEKRRGRKTLHEKYGIETALLAGDVLLVLAYEHLIRDCSKENSKEILDLFTKTGVRICEGQSLDMEFEARPDVSIMDYLDMAYRKTAITTETWCLIGATLANGTQEQQCSLAEYGKNLGLAFQIQDDYLDIAGKESVFGKPIGKDLLEGKKTYVFLRALEKAKKEDRAMLLRIRGRNSLSKNDIPSFKKLYERLGVLHDTRNEVEKYTAQAIKSISVFPENEGRRFLESLAKLLLARNR